MCSIRISTHVSVTIDEGAARGASAYLAESDAGPAGQICRDGAGCDILLQRCLRRGWRPTIRLKSKPWDSLHPPSSKYWLGADRLGRDQLSRLIYGARVSLLIGIGGVGMAVMPGHVHRRDGWLVRWRLG